MLYAKQIAIVHHIIVVLSIVFHSVYRSGDQQGYRSGSGRGKTPTEYNAHTLIFDKMKHKTRVGQCGCSGRVVRGVWEYRAWLWIIP